MNRFLKWLLALAGVVVLLVVLVAVILPIVIDPNNYKEDIRNAVFEKTGRELTIGGDIEWRVFPSLRLDLSDLSLSNRAGFGDRPALSIEEARVAVKLMPVFGKEVEMGQVVLKGVSAYLRQNTDGQNNWEDLTGAPSGSAVTGAAAESEIEISHGTLILSNTKPEVAADSSNVNLSGADLVQNFNLEGDFSVSLVQEELVGKVEFSALVQSVTRKRWFRVEGLDVSFKGEKRAAGEAIPLSINLTANAEVDLAGDHASLSEIAFRFFDLRLDGGLNINALSSAPSYAGEFSLAEFSPKSLLKDLGMEMPATKDNSALTTMRGEMKFAASPGNFNAQELNVKLDKSTFNGSFVVQGHDSLQLAYDFEIDKLNLDDYSSADTSDNGDNNRAESNNPIQALGVFFILPGSGDLRIGELVTSGLTVTDISVKTKADMDALRLSPVSSKLYGGKQQGDIKIDISGDHPILTTNQVLTGVQVGSLLYDFTGNALLQGTGDFYIKIRTDLTSPDTLRQALTGDIGLSVIDGAIEGIDVAETIGAIRSVMGEKVEPPVESSKEKRTEFSEFLVTGVFDKGLLTSDDLLLQSPLLVATGSGNINLVNETVDYVLMPELVDDPGVEGSDKLSGIPIPIKITGSFNAPEFTLDIISGLSDSQNAQLNRKKEELATRLFEKVFGGKKDKNKKKTKNQEESGN